MDLRGAVEGLIELEGGGSEVEVTQILSEGTKIATISVDNVSTDLYAPEGGGSEVEVTQVLASGQKIATISVDNVPTDLYAPIPPAATEVEVTQVVTEGTKIATITVDNVSTDLYAPEGGGGVLYVETPHKVGTYTFNNVTKDVWECTFLFPPQYYGEGQHDLTTLNIDRMLMMQGVTNISTASYQTPFYQNNSNFEYYRWASPILIVHQPSEWYGKEIDRTVTIRYTVNE